MAATVYVLCAVTSCLCAAVLIRAYLGGRVRLLLWAALCFIGLAVNNIFLVLDRVIFTEIDMRIVRSSTAFAAALILLFGLIWESK